MTEEIKKLREELFTYITFGDGEGGTGGERWVGWWGKRRGTGDKIRWMTPG